MKLLRGYAFVSDLPFPDIVTVLDRDGPWQWTLRDNEHWGDYLWTRAENATVRLVEETDHFGLDIKFEDDDAARFDVLIDTLLTRVLPSIGARDVRLDEDHY